jgi:hypothetical protein
MKQHKNIYTGIAVVMAIFLASCAKDYGNLNNPTAQQFLANASKSELNNLVSGTESGMRNNLSVYLDDIGTIGREGYRFSGSEPRYVTDLLGDNESTLGGSNFYITNPWTSRYRVIKNCNLLIEAANNSTLIPDVEKRGYVGFATTIKAYQLLLNVNLTYANGIRVNVSDPENLGPIVGYEEGLSTIASLLDSAKLVLSTASVSFPLAGFNGFNDAAGLIQVNRAIAARVAAYRKRWPDVLTALNESFFGLSKDFYVGVYNVFGTGSGDQLNPMFIPRNQTGEVRVANPSYASNITAGDDRINKAPLRTSIASLSGLSSDRDVWVYTSNTAQIPIIRNEELILLYAEANIQTNVPIEAVKAINIIRAGHNVGPYAGAITQDALINQMLYQRWFSLFYEGHRWIDVRRYDQLNTLPLDRPSDNIWVEFPLPVSEQ